MNLCHYIVLTRYIHFACTRRQKVKLYIFVYEHGHEYFKLDQSSTSFPLHWLEATRVSYHLLLEWHSLVTFLLRSLSAFVLRQHSDENEPDLRWSRDYNAPASSLSHN